MKLPHSQKAQVPFSKLKDYLLSTSHPIGKSKAKFFLSVGFNDTNVELLEEGIRKIAVTEDVKEVIRTRFGEKYVVDGSMQTPDNEIIRIRTIWIVEEDGTIPRLITAYPL